MKIRRHCCYFNDLGLPHMARECHLRSLPPGARRLAKRFGLSPTMATLLAGLAGLGDGGGRDR
jgi:hypothetical protein